MEIVPIIDAGLGNSSYVVDLGDGSALVVDAPPIERFAAGHVPKSLSIELRDQFGTWLGWLAHPNQPIVIVADDDQDIADLEWQMLNVGFEPPKGRLAGGIDAWRHAALPVAETMLVPPGGVTADRPILDVRQRSEWDTSHVAGAIHVELGDVSAKASDLPGGVQVHCGHGQRAMTAASLLEREGVDAITVTTGGPADVTAAVSGAESLR